MKYYLVIKESEMSNHRKIWINLKFIWLDKISHPEKSCIGYVFNYMTFQERQNYRDGIKMNGCQEGKRQMKS